MGMDSMIFMLVVTISIRVSFLFNRQMAALPEQIFRASGGDLGQTGDKLEQWRAQQAQDFERSQMLALLKRIRVAETCWVNCWHLIEQEPYRYDFSSLERQVAAAKKTGFGVACRLPNSIASCPACWRPRQAPSATSSSGPMAPASPFYSWTTLPPMYGLSIVCALKSHFTEVGSSLNGCPANVAVVVSAVAVMNLSPSRKRWRRGKTP